MKSNHLFGKFTNPLLQSYWNFIFSFKSIIYIEIYAVLLLAKFIPNYAFLVCKIFGSKIQLCKIFDIFQVCLEMRASSKNSIYYFTLDPLKLSSPRPKRAGPKGLRAESARAFTGKRNSHSGRGEDFLSRQPNFFTETAVTPERKVEKWFPMWEINRHAEG